jgi:hypothetical protein
MTYNSSTSTIALYLNGTQLNSASNTINAQNSQLRVGGLWTPATAGYYFDGYLSNVRVSNTVRTVTSIPTAPFTSDANTTLLTCQGNRFVDVSGTPKTLTPSGGPRVQAFQPFSPTASYTTALYGGSGYFAGGSNNLGLSTQAALPISTQEFTVEFWAYKLDAWSTSNQYIFNDDGVGGFQIWVSSVGGVIRLGRSTIAIVLDYNYSNLQINTWTHFAYSRKGNDFALWVNGSRVATTTNTNGFASSNGPQTIGGYTSSGWNGYLSNVRVVKGTYVYDPASTSITVPTAPVTAITNTSLLLNMTNAGIYDAAVQNDLITAGAAVTNTTIKQWPLSSVSFNGSNSFVRAPYNTIFNLGTSNFTIEFWVYFNSVALGQTIAGRHLTTSAGDWAIYTATNGNLNYYLSSTGSTWNLANQVSIGSISVGTWYYVALVRNGSVFTPYIGTTPGSAPTTGTTTTTASALATITQDLTVGAANNSLTFLNGYVQDFRFTVGAARPITTVPSASFPTR